MSLQAAFCVTSQENALSMSISMLYSLNQAKETGSYLLMVCIGTLWNDADMLQATMLQTPR